MERIFTDIDGKIPDYLEFWKKISAIESPSSSQDGVNRVADEIQRFAQQRGFAVTRAPQENSGDMMLVELQEGVGEPIALLAHMDTVHAIGSFGPEPVKEQDGVLYGPGVYDCKGGIAVALLAMDAIKNSGSNHRPVRLILNADEEDGSYSGDSGVKFMKDAAQGCAAAFNCECGKPGSVTVGRKGILKAEITVTGVAAHAGNGYFVGASAIREAAHKVIELEKHSQKDGITYNCGVISGGTVGNIVPEQCRIVTDIRFFNDAQAAEARDVLEKVTEQTHVPGTSAVVKTIGFRPAMEQTDGTMKLLQTVKDALERHGFETLEPMFRGGGSDSCYTVAVGVPTLCSVGIIGQYEHTVRECAEIGSLPVRAKMLAVSVLAV